MILIALNKMRDLKFTCHNKKIFHSITRIDNILKRLKKVLKYFNIKIFKNKK